MHLKTSSTQNLFIDFGSGYNPRKGYSSCDITCLPNLDFVCKDNKIYNEQEINDNSVDKIYCKNVLHHVNDLEDLLKNFYRYLKKDGILEVIEPTKDAYYSNLCLDNLWYRYVIPRKEIWISQKYRDYVSIAKQIGFCIDEHITMNEKDIFYFRKS